MKRSEKREQLVRAVQEYVAQEGLSPADFIRIVHNRGGNVSGSTLRRIIKADEFDNFSFESLQEASKALFKVDSSPTPLEDINSPEAAEIEALRAVASLTNSEFEDAQKRIAELEKHLAEANEKLSQFAALENQLTAAEEKLVQLVELSAFYKSQMIEKDKQIDNLWRMFEK